jgi:hypothetical protein
MEPVINPKNQKEFLGSSERNGIAIRRNWCTTVVNQDLTAFMDNYFLFLGHRGLSSGVISSRFACKHPKLGLNIDIVDIYNGIYRRQFFIS